MDETTFRYSATCSFPDCPEPPRYKVAAPWSYGPLHELKNYGLSCEGHREAVLDRGRCHREALAVGDDETVGPVELYAWSPGLRDSERPRLPEAGR